MTSDEMIQAITKHLAEDAEKFIEELFSLFVIKKPEA